MSSPVKKFSLGGVQVAIWENESKEGTRFSTVTLSRAYKDKKDEWKNTGSLRTSDLPKAALGLQKAYEHLTLKEPQETA